MEVNVKKEVVLKLSGNDVLLLRNVLGSFVVDHNNRANLAGLGPDCRDKITREFVGDLIEALNKAEA